MENIFLNIVEPIHGEIVKERWNKENVRIETIYSKGQESPWMEQEESEWVLLIQGNAVIEYEDHCVNLRAGDVLEILPGQRHRVKETSVDPICIWLCVFYSKGD
ncbi:MAG: cupin domain-containing protein [Tissierellia bacterium]|nr:cupin domain-containing protein [Tissierellia bacterium]